MVEILGEAVTLRDELAGALVKCEFFTERRVPCDFCRLGKSSSSNSGDGILYMAVRHVVAKLYTVTSTKLDRFLPVWSWLNATYLIKTNS